MGLHSISLVVMVCAAMAEGGKDCSVVEHKKMQADFTNCSGIYTEEHFNSEMRNVCDLVRNVVESCGEMWTRCHSDMEVRRMRDLHIEALLRQYGEQGELEGCQLVEEYRESGRTLPESESGVTCSDEKTLSIQTNIQTCSHSTAISVYEAIQDLTSVKIISHKLCKALTTIGTVCIKHLNECFAEDDIKQMRKSHLEEMKTFLLRISQEKVTGNVFENCKVMEYVENEGIVVPEHEATNTQVDAAMQRPDDDIEKEEDVNDKVEEDKEANKDMSDHTVNTSMATTEDTPASQKQLKGARSVTSVVPTSGVPRDTTSTDMEYTTAVDSNYVEESTDWSAKIEQKSVSGDKVFGDKVDEAVTDKVDEVVSEIVEEEAVMKEYTHSGKERVKAVSVLASLAILLVLA